MMVLLWVVTLQVGGAGRGYSVITSRFLIQHVYVSARITPAWTPGWQADYVTQHAATTLKNYTHRIVLLFRSRDIDTNLFPYNSDQQIRDARMKFEKDKNV